MGFITKPIGKLVDKVTGGGTSSWQPTVYDYDRNQFADPNMQDSMRRYNEQIAGSGDNYRASALNALQNQVTGNAPSVAQRQLMMGQDRTLKNNLAMAANARGSNIGLAQRNAMNANADASANIAGQAALLRAQEQAQAAGQLGQLSQQQQQFYEQLKFNRQQAEMKALQDLEAMRGSDVMNRNALEKGVALQNSAQRASNIGGLLNMGAGALGLGAMFSDKNLKTNIVEEEPKKKNEFQNALAGAFKPAQVDQSATPLMANPFDRRNINLNLGGAGQIAPAQMFAGAQSAFSGGQKMGQGILNTPAAMPSGEFVGATPTAAPGFQIAQQQPQFSLSDETKKEGKEKSSGDLYGFLDALSAYKYNYKDPKFGEGDHYSVMAQDLEKSPVGKKMVLDTPEGKLVDYNKGLPAMLAAQAQLHARIKKLEGK